MKRHYSFYYEWGYFVGLNSQEKIFYRLPIKSSFWKGYANGIVDKELRKRNVPIQI